MKQDRLAQSIGDINHKYIEEAENYQSNSKKIWIKWSVDAACICLIALGSYILMNSSTLDSTGNPVLQWTEDFKAEDYFKYNQEDEDNQNSNSSSDSILAAEAIPYAYTRSFSDQREQLEAENIIPVLDEFPLFECTVNYNEDGSIYSLSLLWKRLEDEYSSFSITAGYEEVDIPECAVDIALDENGNVVTPSVTVTERDGYQIITEGTENTVKTITFQNNSGWYQIEGSDSYADVVGILDWIWENPINFDYFPIEAGDEFIYTTIDQYPDAFSGYIPDFKSLGFVEVFNTLILNNYIPYSFEGSYDAQTEAEGTINIHWFITTNPDYYDLKDSVGELSDLTEQIIVDTLDDNSSLAFTWDEYFIRIYSDTPQEVWYILKDLQLNAI